MADILVVDDDSTICRNLKDILIKEGHSVEATTSSREALKMCEKGEFTVAIIDIVMPEINGMDLLAELKKKRSDLLVIMITAFSTVEGAVTAMKKGATDYIAKPFKTNEIQTTVRRALVEADFVKRIDSIEKSPDIERILSSLDSPIRRSTIVFLEIGRRPFTEIMRGIEVNDPTKFNFHLRKLKSDGLVAQDEDKSYSLTETGKRALEILMQLNTQ